VVCLQVLWKTNRTESEICGHLVWLFKNRKSVFLHKPVTTGAVDDDDDDEGQINFSVALSLKTTRTRNNKPKQ